MIGKGGNILESDLYSPRTQAFGLKMLEILQSRKVNKKEKKFVKFDAEIPILRKFVNLVLG